MTSFMATETSIESPDLPRLLCFVIGALPFWVEAAAASDFFAAVASDFNFSINLLGTAE